MWNTFSNSCHLLSVYDCACVPFQGGERESGRNSWLSVSSSVDFACRREFPADYTEVKWGGPDKRKISPVPHHTNLQH